MNRRWRGIDGTKGRWNEAMEPQWIDEQTMKRMMKRMMNRWTDDEEDDVTMNRWTDDEEDYETTMNRWTDEQTMKRMMKRKRIAEQTMKMKKMDTMHRQWSANSVSMEPPSCPGRGFHAHRVRTWQATDEYTWNSTKPAGLSSPLVSAKLIPNTGVVHVWGLMKAMG